MRTHSTIDTKGTGAEQVAHIRAEAERRKKLFPFNWHKAPLGAGHRFAPFG